jgi:hypothetical protein
VSSVDVAGALTSQGHNLIGNGTGGSGFDPTDLVGTSANPIDPLLGPLQNNGGPTQTMAPLAGSPALNAGDPAQRGVADQRGVVRSGGVNIGAYQASAASLTFTAPATVTAGTPFSITVQAVDPLGQTAVGYAGTVHFTASNGAMATYTFTAVDGGQHTFNNLVLRQAGTLTITGVDTADASITGTTTLTVTPAAADHIAFTLTNAITAGVPFAITVTVQDAYGNTETGYQGMVHFTLTGPAMAQADYTFAATDMGSHTFNNLTLGQAGDYTLAGMDSADPTISSSTPFTVSG